MLGADGGTSDPSANGLTGRSCRQAADGSSLKVEKAGLNGCAQQCERGGFMPVKIAEERLVNRPEHGFIDPSPQPVAQRGHVVIGVGKKVKVIIEARRTKVGEMNERQLKVQGVLAGSENPTNKQFPHNFLQCQRIGLAVVVRSLPDTCFDGMNMGLRLVPEHIKHPLPHRCLVHRPDMLPICPRSVNRWLTDDR